VTPVPETSGPTIPPRRSRREGGRYTGTIIMVGLFLALAGALFLLTNNPQAGVLSPTATTVPPPVVWDLSAGTASSVRLDTISQTVALQVLNGQWQITAPTNAAASQFQVGAAVDQLKKITAQQVITAPTDLDQYGLSTPGITITLVISGVTPPENRLLIGSTTIDGGSYYIKAADKPDVYVVLNTLVEQLRTWISSPPVAEATPTPLAILSPEPVITGTVTTTLTAGPAGPPPPPAGSTPSTAPTGGTDSTPSAAPATTAPETAATSAPATPGATGGTPTP
jgi:hypothetical protein